MNQRFSLCSLVVGLVCLVASSVQAAVPAAERDALVALYNATNGQAWSDRTNWLGPAGTECSWFGVQCDSAQSRVIEISLIGNGLSGTIPAEIAGLTHLTDLDFGGNDLEGPIPLALTTMLELESFAAYWNRLSGSIPEEMGRMPSLRSLLLAGNQFEGQIPSSFRNLTQLQTLSLHVNRLSGTIPAWIEELTNLRELTLGGNELTGTIPSGITKLVGLTQLDLAGNRLSGSIPEEIGSIVALVSLNLEENGFSGEIPAGVWTLTNLESLRLGGNQLTGQIPTEVDNLALLDTLYMEHNQIDGEIPSSIGNLSALTRLSLGENRFTGEIPREMGQLTNLKNLDLERNALRGSIPVEMTNLINLVALGIGYNALVTDDATVRSFINAIHEDGSFEETQTVPPTNVAGTDVTDRSVIVSWTMIDYLGGGGGYEVEVTPSAGGTRIVTTTASKDIDSIVIRGLAAATGYVAIVRSTTHPHGFQQNFIRSEASDSVSFTTTESVIGPAIVDVVSRPGGLIQIGGVSQNATSYTVANFGDIATSITLEQDETFFTQSPSSFSLEPGARRIVTVSSVPNQTEGYHWGHASPAGEGVPEELSVTVPLLSVAASSGAAVAVAVTKRIEVKGTPNTDSVGSATFDNVGTATLHGILISDAAWIDTPNDLIVIRPGERQSVGFTVRRARRPDADISGMGSLFATLRLVYVDGSDPGKSRSRLDPQDGTIGPSTSLVTVVDTTTPPASASSIPSLDSGEVARIVAGALQSGASGSDLSLTNSFGSSSLTDLEIYFQPAGAAVASVASFDPMPPSGSLALGSVLGSVFSETTSVGSLLVRTPDQDKLLLSALRIDGSDPSGVFAESMPVLRSDRGVEPGDSTALTGLRSDSAFTTTLYIQEVSGGEAIATVEAYDAEGNLLGLPSRETIVPFGLVESVSIPVGATSLIVRNDEDESSGALAAWAFVTNPQTHEAWSVSDWSRHHGIETSEALRVPLVLREGEEPSRRRPVRRPAAGKNLEVYEGLIAALSGSRPTRTLLSIFNPDDTDSVIEIVYWETGVESGRTTMTVRPKATRAIDDVSTFVRGRDGSSTGYLVMEPRRGSVAVSARISRTGGNGGTVATGVPVVASAEGLRLGQVRLFAGLADSTRDAVDSGLPGGTRTSIGIAEVAGSDITVRARLLAFDGKSLAGTSVSRDFKVGARHLIIVDDMARSILGEQREALFGEMRNLQLELRVVAGDGAASVFVITEDAGSGDPVLRME